MTARKLQKIAVLIPTFALAILLVQQNYNWIFGIMIGAAIALSSCEMIQKAVSNSFVRKGNRRALFFMFGFFLRFVIFAALLYLAIVFFKVSVVAIAISFTAVQLFYPFYLLQTLRKSPQGGGSEQEA